ncbi:unnamed protein product [Cuscuta campestris]|uniref:CCHC-type domain-containing protein n=1 Tax=Cuscuta campestris TaxID=132261 RepID=A0A484MIR3_9ASTE|nr:unnamed protein product [Cuscuta campestris]
MATAVDLGRELLRRRISLAYGGGNVGLQGAVASTVFTNSGLVRGFIRGYIATRRVYGPTYGVEHTVSSNYYKYFEMNHAVEAFIVLPGGVDTMEGLGEGQSTTRPLLFDETNYTYWKEGMRIYIQSTNFLLWRIIKNGEDVPMKKVEETNVPKTEDEYDAQDIKKVENNAKAINIIYCAVNPDDYRKISYCTTAKEMWDKLEITYEGTDQVREAKIDFLTHEYELFRMKENEKTDEMFERFSKIVNDLHALKKTYTDKELVRKILRSLTPEWRSKVDAIQESIGITNVTIDGLRGNLKTYESTILFPSLGEQKKKGIALKVTSSQEPAMEESSDEDNEFGLVIKKFHKFMRKEYERKGKKHGGPPKCYGCGEVGHIKPKCPNAKNEKEKKPFKKHRAYISWGVI